jgi:uncharacterized Tic20 family protein
LPPAEGESSSASESVEGRSLALVAQVAIFNGLLIVPLIVRLTAGKRNEFVRLHATEALNRDITVLITMLVFALSLGRAWMALGVLAYFGWFLYALVVGIIGGVKAWRGVRWRYPVNLRIVRGA